MAYHNTDIGTVTIKNLRESDVWCDEVTFVRFCAGEYYWVVCVSNDAFTRYYLDDDGEKQYAGFIKYDHRLMLVDVKFDVNMHYRAYKVMRSEYEPHTIVPISPDRFINEYIEHEGQRYAMIEASDRFISTLPLPEVEHNVEHGVQVAEDWSNHENFKAQWEKFANDWCRSDEEFRRRFKCKE